MTSKYFHLPTFLKSLLLTVIPLLPNLLNFQLLPDMPFKVTLFKISLARFDFMKSNKINTIKYICLPDPSLSFLSDTISWGRLSIHNCKRTFKLRFPKVCIGIKLFSNTVENSNTTSRELLKF